MKYRHVVKSAEEDIEIPGDSICISVRFSERKQMYLVSWLEVVK